MVNGLYDSGRRPLGRLACVIRTMVSIFSGGGHATGCRAGGVSPGSQPLAARIGETRPARSRPALAWPGVQPPASNRKCPATPPCASAAGTGEPPTPRYPALAIVSTRFAYSLSCRNWMNRLFYGGRRGKIGTDSAKKCRRAVLTSPRTACTPPTPEGTHPKPTLPFCSKGECPHRPRCALWNTSRKYFLNSAPIWGAPASAGYV